MALASAGQQAAFEQDHVGWVAFDGRAQILERVGLRHHAKIVFERKDLANSDAVNGLRIRKNNADSARLYRCVKNFAIRCFVEKFHRWLP